MKIVYLRPLKRLRIFAFSLVEMLMALLVASLLMAALAPVMTRKTELASFEGDMNPPLNSMWVYTNPGNYGFEIPDNVNNISIQASGGGGGGAGASFKTYKEGYTVNKTFTVPKGVYEITFTLTGGGGAGGSGYARNANDNCGLGKQIPHMADSGKDLCAVKGGPTNTGNIYVTRAVNSGELCDSTNCCWINIPDCAGSNCAEPRTVCKYDAAVNWCAADNTTLNGNGRLLSKTEMQRIVDDGRYVGANGLNLCGLSDDHSMENKYGIPSCGMVMSCFGSSNNHCYRAFHWLSNHDEYRLWGYPYLVPNNQYKDQANGFVCVRELDNWFHFTGAGGSSGSKYTNTIKVSPGDTINLTIGEGGASAAAGVYGYPGTATYLSHTDKKTGNTVTYYAGGGKGGNAATSTANGPALGAYAPDCSQGGSCSFVVSANGGKGYAGSSIQGGTGAGGAVGGTIEVGKGKGDDAKANSGFGGGGGVCMRNVRTPSLCSSGGKGGSGYAEIEYSVASPGGGGGAGGTIGVNNETHISKSINLNVTPGDVLSITIGAGGSGGGVNASGYEGKDTILLTKNGTKYVFKGGKGGNTGTFDTLNRQVGGIGGYGGNYPDASKDEYPEIVAPLTTKGMNGAEDTLGISGGEGGKSVNGYTGGCGGMQVSDDTTISTCNSNSENGESAIKYDASANRYGGTGGGGGGINLGTGNKGTGGNGADGYLLIKWNR